MAVPTRPASGAVVESAWGQVVHDTAVAQDIQVGQATTSHAANRISGTITITFPRPFASPPRVIYTTTNFNYAAAADGSVPTATSCKLVTYRLDGTAPTASVPVDWIAIGPRA